MLLYKFKSLEKFDHTIDILLNERLFCASFKKLNDPCEGLYNYIGAFNKAFSPAFDISKTKRIPDKKICSLSESLSDVRMWSYYANSHKGIAIEIELDENEVEQIIYIKNLLEKTGQAKSEYILTRKTNHWGYENEYRILSNKKHYPIKNKIRAIYLGLRIAPLHKKLLKKMISLDIHIYETELETESIKIIKGKCIR